jgi:rhodanese-related sulfurtransferase
MKNIIDTLLIKIGLMPTPEVEELSYLEFRRRISRETHTIDVRTKEEFAQGYIYGALNLDSRDPQLFRKLPKGRMYLLYSSHGNRSKQVAQQMRKAGFRKVCFLSQGLDVWEGNLVCE